MTSYILNPFTNRLDAVDTVGGINGISQIKTQTFTFSGTYTPTAGMRSCLIEVLGGGGAGGGAVATSTACSCSAGGGSGEYAKGLFSAAAIGSSQTVTIGAGGAGVSGATGNNGGNTSVGALISAFGGLGGTSSSEFTNTNCAGGLGGTGGSGGDFRTNGQTGFYGYAAEATGIVILDGGYGGCSQYGAGGYVSNTGTHNQGTAGTGYGSGGAGCSNHISEGALTGGNGASGIVIITEYI